MLNRNKRAVQRVFVRLGDLPEKTLPSCVLAAHQEIPSPLAPPSCHVGGSVFFAAAAGGRWVGNALRLRDSAHAHVN